MSATNRHELGATLGTDTFVTLPNGSDFDTKIVEASSMKHYYKFEFEVASYIQHTYSGIQSNIHINFNKSKQKRSISKVTQTIDTQNKQNM